MAVPGASVVQRVFPPAGFDDLGAPRFVGLVGFHRGFIGFYGASGFRVCRVS